MKLLGIRKFPSPTAPKDGAPTWTYGPGSGGGLRLELAEDEAKHARRGAHEHNAEGLRVRRGGAGKAGAKEGELGLEKGTERV